MAHYAIACQTHELSVSFGENQIFAFLAFIHAQYYGGSSIDSHWYTVKQLPKEHGLYVSPKAVNFYKVIRKNCGEIQDNKVPVSLTLLEQLCNAASLLLRSYNAKLARAMFVLAFAFSMRVCEYCDCARDGNLLHNVYSHAVSFTPQGLSLHLFLDKVSSFSPTPKHRMKDWVALPPYTRAVLQAYIAVHPRKGPNFFCHPDSSPIKRDYFVNFLTDWKFLRITPHSFRLAYPSLQVLKGENMTDILYQARWSPTSKAVEAYTRPELVDMHPQQIHDQLVCYLRTWSLKKLSYIAAVTVESEDDDLHPIAWSLKTNFPKFKAQFSAVLPPQFPDEGARIRIQKEYNALLQGTYLKKRPRTLFLNAQLKQYRQKLSVSMRRVTKRAIQTNKAFSFSSVTAKAKDTVAQAASPVKPAPVKEFSEQVVQVETPCPHCLKLPSQQLEISFDCPQSYSVPLEPSIIIENMASSWLSKRHLRLTWLVSLKTPTCVPSTPSVSQSCPRTSSWLAVSAERGLKKFLPQTHKTRSFQDHHLFPKEKYLWKAAIIACFFQTLYVTPP